MTHKKSYLPAAVLLAALIVTLAACGGGTAKGPAADDPVEPSAATVTETPAPTPVPDPDPELAELYGAYRDAMQQLLSDMEARGRAEAADVFDHGVVRDVDGDGWPELMVLYSPDGIELHGMIGRRLLDGSVRYLDLTVGMADENVHTDIMYGEVADVPTLYFSNTVETDGGLSGSIQLASIEDSGARVYSTLRWEEDQAGENGAYYVDGIADEEQFNELFDGIDSLECSAPSDSDPTCDELVAQLAELHEVYGREG